MKRRSSLLGRGLVAACMLLVLPCVAAQEFGEVARELRRNIDALKGYTWKSKIEFSVDGQLTNTEVYASSMDEGGNLDRKLISSDGKETKEESEARLSLSSIRDLLDAYSHMTPEAFKTTFGENPRFVYPGKDGEPTRIQANGVVSRGDTMQIWVDPTSHRLEKLQLETTLQGNPVHAEVEFKEFEEGDFTYAARSVLETNHKKKSLTLVTENSDFARTR